MSLEKSIRQSTERETSRMLLEVLNRFEKAWDDKSWREVEYSISALMDVMEDIEHHIPLPWED